MQQEVEETLSDDEFWGSDIKAYKSLYHFLTYNSSKLRDSPCDLLLYNKNSAGTDSTKPPNMVDWGLGSLTAASEWQTFLVEFYNFVKMTFHTDTVTPKFMFFGAAFSVEQTTSTDFKILTRVFSGPLQENILEQISTFVDQSLPHFKLIRSINYNS